MLLRQVFPRSAGSDTVDRSGVDPISVCQFRNGCCARSDIGDSGVRQNREGVAFSEAVPRFADHVSDVVVVGPWVEVARVDAPRGVAGVEDVQSVGDGPAVVEFPRHPVRVVLTSVDGELAVSLTGAFLHATESTTPYPALLIGEPRIDASRDAFPKGRGTADMCVERPVNVGMTHLFPAFVVAETVASGVVRTSAIGDGTDSVIHTPILLGMRSN